MTLSVIGHKRIEEEAWRAPQKILIIDDDETVCHLIQTVAEKHGVDSIIARNGKDAENILYGDEQVDVIFLDLLIPYKSGWDIIKSIEETSHRKNTPVVILTGAPINLGEKKKLGEKVSAIIDKGTFNLELFEQLFDDVLAG